MNYEKAYKDALERAKNMIDDLRKGKDILAVSELEAMFPELRESEDEKIRKELIELVRETVSEPFRGGITVNKERKYIAWLEKQKINPVGDFGRGYDCGYEACLNSHGAEWLEKQKPSCWDSPVMTHEMIRGYSTTEQDDDVAWNALRAWAESHGHTPFELYPKAEWSEEDETMINHIIEALPKWANGLITILPSQAEEYVKRLKSLRPSPSWKPTEEQMKALKEVAYNIVGTGTATDIYLVQLYEQLKAIKEEKK